MVAARADGPGRLHGGDDGRVEDRARGRPRRRRGFPDRRRRAGSLRRRRQRARSSSTPPAASPPRGSSTPTTTSTSGPPVGWPWTPPCSAGSPSSIPSGVASTRTSWARRPRPGWAGWPAPAARRRWTTTTSSPRHGGDVLGAEIDAAQRIGLRFLATRGSMDLGQSQGGLPPDHVVEDIDTILARHGGGGRPAPRPVARLDAADRRRALLTLLGDRGPPARVGRPGPRPGGAPAHPPGRDDRRGALLRRALRPDPRWPTWSRSAGSATTSGSRTASTSTTSAIKSAGRLGHGCRPLPLVERPTGRRHRAHP